MPDLSQHALPLAFALASLANLWFSRGALARPASHGFPRFFAFQAVIGLFVLAHPRWDDGAPAPVQAVGWALMLLSLALALAAYATLRLHGRRDAAARNDPALIGFEATSALVTHGVFRWLRHPMYAAVALLAWALFCKHPTAFGALLATAASAACVWTARRDEAECLAFFGAPYAAYMQRTRRFVPGVW